MFLNWKINETNRIIQGLIVIIYVKCSQNLRVETL